MTITRVEASSVRSPTLNQPVAQRSFIAKLFSCLIGSKRDASQNSPSLQGRAQAGAAQEKTSLKVRFHAWISSFNFIKRLRGITVASSGTVVSGSSTYKTVSPAIEKTAIAQRVDTPDYVVSNLGESSSSYLAAEKAKRQETAKAAQEKREAAAAALAAQKAEEERVAQEKIKAAALEKAIREVQLETHASALSNHINGLGDQNPMQSVMNAFALLSKDANAMKLIEQLPGNKLKAFLNEGVGKFNRYAEDLGYEPAGLVVDVKGLTSGSRLDAILAELDTAVSPNTTLAWALSQLTNSLKQLQDERRAPAPQVLDGRLYDNHQGSSNPEAVSSLDAARQGRQYNEDAVRIQAAQLKAAKDKDNGGVQGDRDLSRNVHDEYLVGLTPEATAALKKKAADKKRLAAEQRQAEAAKHASAVRYYGVRR